MGWARPRHTRLQVGRPPAWCGWLVTTQGGLLLVQQQGLQPALPPGTPQQERAAHNGRQEAGPGTHSCPEEGAGVAGCGGGGRSGGGGGQFTGVFVAHNRGVDKVQGGQANCGAGGTSVGLNRAPDPAARFGMQY